MKILEKTVQPAGGVGSIASNDFEYTFRQNRKNVLAVGLLVGNFPNPFNMAILPRMEE